MFRRLAAIAAVAAVLLPVSLARAAVPSVDAASYVVVNPATGETLAARAPERQLAMASTTKIMTALVTLENAQLDRPARGARRGRRHRGLHRIVWWRGETLTVRQLLTALMVPSGNDAAITLAQGVGGSQAGFVEMMNATANRLGLSRRTTPTRTGSTPPATTPAWPTWSALSRGDAQSRSFVASSPADGPASPDPGVSACAATNPRTSFSTWIRRPTASRPE